MACMVRSFTGQRRVRPSRSRIPSTAVFPTGPRPARSFLCSCLFASLPPMKHSSSSTMPFNFSITESGTRFAQTVQDEPRRFLCDANLFRELQATDALPRRHEQIHRIEPLVQRNFAALENGSGADGESQHTVIAEIVSSAI